MRTAAAVVFTSFLNASVVPAAVVSNAGVSFLSGSFISGANYAIGVAQSLGGSVIDTSTFFNVTEVGTSPNSLLQAVDHNLDEATDWYVVPAGAAFTEANIAAGMFRPLVVGDTFSSPYALVGTQTFYFGFDTGLSPSPTRGEVMGWVRISHTAPNLTLLGSAVAYGEPGIIVGTTAVAPEPSMSLMGMAVVQLMSRRRRAHR